MDVKKPPDAVIAAVFERQARLRHQIVAHQEVLKRARQNVAAAEEEEVRMRDELEQLREFLRPYSAAMPPSETGLFTVQPKAFPGRPVHVIYAGGSEPAGQVTELDGGDKLYSGSAIRSVVLEKAIQLLDGTTLTTDQIVDELGKLGIRLNVANPTVRVSQILSQDSRFQNRRGLGWWLMKPDSKNEPPEGQS